MRNPKTTLLAAASGLALFAATALPANATSFVAASSTSSSDLVLVKSGGGGGGGTGGGGHGGGFGNFGAIGGHPSMGGGGVGGGMGMHGVPHGGNSFAHMGGNNAHIARSGNFNGNVGHHERFADNGNWNWNGNRHDHDHDHHHHFNRFYAYPFLYGGYYAYNDYGYGDCGWLYRRAVATGSPYWWNRYYACVY